MEWGPQIDFLRNLQRTTGEIPKALKDRPSLTRWTVEYFSAFNVLNDSRQLTQGGLGPIPLSEMFAYMEIFHVKGVDERHRFITMVKALDRMFITHTNSKMKAERDKKAPRKGKRKR